MKNLVLAILMIGSVYFDINTGAQEVLTNRIVVNLVHKRLPSSVIVSKIKASKNNFDVSTDTLIWLKENEVPDDVLNAMLDVAGDISKHVVQMDINNPLSPHESGIYYLKKTENKTEMVQLEPTVYSQSNSGGYLAQSLTYGLAKVSVNITIDGSKSRMSLEDKHPEFYFYFDAPKSALGQNNNWWFSTATSPNEFLVVHLKEKRKAREVEIGSSNILGSSRGVADANKTVFKFEKIAAGIYKVYFEQPLSGEYCFMYAGGVPQGYAIINKVYDFGINKGGNGNNAEDNTQRNKVY